MRNFLLGREADENGEVVLDGDDFHYLAHVLRKNVGDRFSATFPSGKSAACEISKIGASSMTVRTAEFSAEKPSLCRIWLLQILPKTPRFELLARQAAEVGVEKIVAIQGDFSNNVALTDSKMARIEKIVREARQQSGSPVATEILCADLGGALEIVAREERKSGSACKILFSETEAPRLGEVLTKSPPLAVAAVGCEGGFSPSERRAFLDAGFSPVHLKTNVLRVETAAIYGLAAIQSRLENFSERSAK